MARKSRASELHELTDDELENRLAEQKADLFNLRFKHVTGQLDNSSRLRVVRRNIARINTLLRDREIKAAEALAQDGQEGVTTNG